MHHRREYFRACAFNFTHLSSRIPHICNRSIRFICAIWEHPVSCQWSLIPLIHLSEQDLHALSRIDRIESCTLARRFISQHCSSTPHSHPICTPLRHPPTLLDRRRAPWTSIHIIRVSRLPGICLFCVLAAVAPGRLAHLCMARGGSRAAETFMEETSKLFKKLKRPLLAVRKGWVRGRVGRPAPNDTKCTHAPPN